MTSEEEKYNQIYRLNILILGESRVGKTALLNQFIEKKFDDFYQASIFDIDDYLTIINKTKLHLKFNTVPGEKKYRAITKPCLYGYHAVLLVYDITDLNSFEKMLLSCRKEFERYGVSKKSLKYLIGNKCDDEENRQMSFNIAKSFAMKTGYRFFECSAKLNQHVEELFQDLFIELIFLCDQRWFQTVTDVSSYDLHYYKRDPLSNSKLKQEEIEKKLETKKKQFCFIL